MYNWHDVNKNILRTIEAQIVQTRLGQNLLVLIEKSVYVAWPWYNPESVINQVQAHT